MLKCCEKVRGLINKPKSESLINVILSKKVRENSFYYKKEYWLKIDV